MRGMALAVKKQEIMPVMDYTWNYIAPGGYGYVTSITVKVLKVESKRIMVQAPLKNGGTKDVWVKPENLRPKR